MINKNLFLWIIIGVIVVLVIGYFGFTYYKGSSGNNQAPSNTGQNTNNGTQNNGSNNGTSQENNRTKNNSGSIPSRTTDQQKQLMNTIVSLAKQGKVINSNFAVRDFTIDDVMKSYGNPDKQDYVAEAKGTYSTYTKQGVVFGFNKGSQIFEVRSFDSKVKTLTCSEVEKVLGKPAYDKILSENQHIIGYAVNSTFKLEFIFPKESTNQPHPPLDHMNVLYPAGTVNSMADDPGRQW